MRRIQKSACCLASLVFVAACERTPSTVEVAPATPEEIIEISVSDELPDLASPPSGILFWSHPALAFNSLLIVADDIGLASYNIEDGNPVDTLPGLSVGKASITYFGFGAHAIGAVITANQSENRLDVTAIDNASRVFIPLAGGPELRGNVRGLCSGRAPTISAPTISEPTVFVVQRDGIQFFTLEAVENGVEVLASGIIEGPDDLVACAIDQDGSLLALNEQGQVFRIDNETAFSQPIISSGVTQSAGLTVLTTTSPGDGGATLKSQIIIADANSNTLHVFDRDSGERLGVIRAIGEDSEIIPGALTTFGTTNGNLGALYRGGAIGFGYAPSDTLAPLVRLAPTSAVSNALNLEEGDAISPRGTAPTNSENDLKIDTTFSPQ